MTSLPRIPRAARGFLVSVSFTILLVLIRFEPSGVIRRAFSAAIGDQNAKTAEAIQSAFARQLGRLQSGTQLLAEHIAAFDPHDSVRIWKAMNEFSVPVELPRGRLSFELIDASGETIAWRGKEAWQHGDSSLAAPKGAKTFFHVLGHQNYASVAIPVASQKGVLVGSLLMQTSFPRVGRILARPGAFDEISELLPLEALDSAGDHKVSRSGVFLLNDASGHPVCRATMNMPSPEEVGQKASASINAFIGISIAFVLFFLWRMVAISRPNWSLTPWRWLAGSVVLWFMRYIWILLAFPSAFFGNSKIFDASYYGTPFGGGITASLGDLFLSIIIYLLSAECLVQATKLLLRDRGPMVMRWLALLGYGFVLIASLFFLRSYGASVRSLVNDSSISLYRPASIIPSLPVCLLIVSALLLTWGTIRISLLLFRIQRKFLVVLHFSRSTSVVESVLAAGILVGIVLFWLLDRTPAFPVNELLTLAVCVVAIDWIVSTKPGGLSIALSLAVCILIPWRIVDVNIHQKDELLVERLSELETRSADTWLNVVLTEATSSTLAQASRWMGEAERGRREGAAFDVWASSSLARTNFSSALIVFDREGREADRFAVGVPMAAQREILRRLNETEEERIQKLTLSISGEKKEFWFTWGTARDSDNAVTGGVAVIVARAGGELFQNEPFGRTPVEAGALNANLYRSWFENGLLVSSEMQRETPAMPELNPQEKTGALVSGWIDERSNGNEYRSFLKKLPDSENRFVAFSIPSLTWHWHVFNLSKWIVLGACLAVMFLIVRIARKVGGGGKLLLPFQVKVSIFFSLLAVVPFIALMFLNRSLLLERNEARLETELNRNLQTIVRHITRFAENRQDFLLGMTNEFCESVASETGIDFSVYGGTTVQGSSRWDLFTASILERRLPNEAYIAVFLEGKAQFSQSEQIANEEYRVGYAPIVIDGERLGVVAVPALYQQQVLEAETTESNALLVAIYGVVILMTVTMVLYASRRISSPVEELTRAISSVADGNWDTHVAVSSRDEFQRVADAFNDMTDQLKESRIEIVRREREGAWREMAKQVAHEIKNPLTPMKLSVQHLVQTFHDRASDREEVLHRIATTLLTQIEALARIANEFSSFARLPERKFERVNLRQIVEQTTQLFANIPGIEIRGKISDPTVEIVADQDELRRAFVNLMRNGIQAMGGRGAMTVQTRVDGPFYTIQFSDTGEGIPPDAREKIFQPNFSTKSEGMGLGLAIVRQTIQDHGGTIDFTTEEGRGTTFTVRLPIAP